MASSFVPRPSRLRLRISDVIVRELRLENSHARRLNAAFMEAEKVAGIIHGYEMRDEDIADIIIAAITQETQQYK